MLQVEALHNRNWTPNRNWIHKNAIIHGYTQCWASQVEPAVKNPPANAGDRREFSPWVWKIPWSRAWQPTPGTVPGAAHGQRSLVRYSPQGRKRSDMTEVT